jgi:hypothetical protein
MSEKSNTQGQEPMDLSTIASISEQSISSLLRAIHNHEEEPLTCAECREQIATVYETNRAGNTFPPPLQAASRHIANCPTCAAEYEALAETMTAFVSGKLPELAEPFVFDLSFLGTSPDASPDASPVSSPTAHTVVPSLWQESLTRGVWTLGEAVRVRLERIRQETTRATFVSLQEYLTPAQSAAALFRSENTNGKAEVLVLPITAVISGATPDSSGGSTPGTAFNVHLAIGPIVVEHATLLLKFVDQATAKPLANLQVTLRNGERQLLAGSMTGEDGSILFEHLSYGRYLIQVRQNQQVWEIPLVLLEGS